MTNEEFLEQRDLGEYLEGLRRCNIDPERLELNRAIIQSFLNWRRQKEQAA